MKLHLGVVDIPYGAPQPSGKRRRKVAVAATSTTGSVAEILEAKYHIFEHFFELHGAEIADHLTDAVKDALADIMNGALAPQNMFQPAEQDIQKAFHTFLTSKEMDGLGYPGIPTQAALQGKSKRFKSGKGAPRPSFVDTGTYIAAFRAWFEE